LGFRRTGNSQNAQRYYDTRGSESPLTQSPRLGVVAGHTRIVVDRSDPRNSGIVTCEPNQQEGTARSDSTAMNYIAYLL
jgi:hypothetical protein